MISDQDFNLADLILEIVFLFVVETFVINGKICWIRMLVFIYIGKGSRGAIALWYCNNVAILLVHNHIARSKVQEYEECISNVSFCMGNIYSIWEIYIHMGRTPEEAGTRQESTPSPQPARSLDNLFVCFGFWWHTEQQKVLQRSSAAASWAIALWAERGCCTQIRRAIGSLREQEGAREP